MKQKFVSLEDMKLIKEKLQIKEIIMLRYIFILMIIFVISFNITAQIGTHIDEDYLPQELENAWWDTVQPYTQVLPWQNAGCLKQLQAEGGFEVEAYVDVTQIMNNPDIEGDSFTEKIINLVDEVNSNNDPYENLNLMLYFPPGQYDLNMRLTDDEGDPITGIEIKRNNVIFKGAGADVTTLHFWYDYIEYIYSNDAGWEYDDSFRIYSNNPEEPIINIGFEDFKIDHTSYWMGTQTFTGDEYYYGRYFVFSNAETCWVSGVHSYHSERHHISIHNSDNIEVSGCYINKSLHRTGGGNGYGVVIGNESQRCLVENNVFRYLRHSMIFGDHAFYNVLGYNYSRENDSQGSTLYEPTDICFHGHSGTDDGPEFNLVEGNIAVFIQFDKAWGENGIRNLIFRNRSTKIADWNLNPFHPQDDNDKQNIVNNYFEFDESASTTWPWTMRGEDHLVKNNKIRDYWGSSWERSKIPSYWDDISYYYKSAPDFILNPAEQWPFHPTNSGSGDISDNPAKDRWYSGGPKTVSAGWDHITTNCYVSGFVNAPGACIDFLRDGERITHTWADANGYFDHTIEQSEFGYFDIKFSCDGYYPYTQNHISLNAPDQSLDRVLEDVFLNYVPTDYVTVTTDLSNNNAFHTIQEAVDCLSAMGSGTINILPGTYRGPGNKNIWWDPNALTEGLHIKIHGASTLTEECIIDCEGSGIAFLFDDALGVGPFTYDELDIIENLVIHDAEQGIVIKNGSPIIRFNTIEECEIDANAGGDINGAGISCKSSAYIYDNEIINCIGNWNDAYISYTFGGGIFIQNNTDDVVIVKDNLISGCAAQDGGGIYCTGSGDIIIDGNKITTCSVIDGLGNNCYPDEGIGISSIDCDNISIKNNLLVGNIPYQSSTQKGAIYAYNCSGIEYLNNTVIQNPDMYGFYIYGGCTTILKNCIVSENYIGISSYSNLSVDYSCVIDNEDENYEGNAEEGIGCVESELGPCIDTTTYQPIWDSGTKSPCIDTGDPTITDADDTPSDIGAVCAVEHRYDIVELPSLLEGEGLKWLSFPALDNIYSDATTTPPYDPDQASWLLLEIMAQDYLVWVRQNELDFVWKFQDIWQGTDNVFSRTDGYKFQMNTAATLEISGFKEPDNTTISLLGNEDDNWVGYWLLETQSVEDAFSQYWEGDNICYIQHQYWSASRKNGVWYYKMSNEQQPTLSYGDMIVIRCYDAISDFSWDGSTPEEEKTVFPETQYFSFEEQPDYIPIYIELEENNLPQEIGALVNGVCIGAVVVEDPLTQINAYTTSTSPGNIELELYYNSRSTNQKVTEYNYGTFENFNLISSQINSGESTNAWFVSLREDSSIIPSPEKVTLSNYPNPFNPTTTISYALPYEDNISLCIYNVKGQLVKQLVEGKQPEGYYDVLWNGKDSVGRKVASGIYYYRINTCGKTLHKKMLMLK